MSYLSWHWSFVPFGLVVVVLAGWHEAGLWRLARIRPDGGAARRRRSLWFYAGLVVLLIALTSPIEYWSYRYFFIHMLQHLLLMFAAPSLLVAGAPWPALAATLPGLVRGRPWRAAGSVLLRPWVSVGLFNAAMICWHLPGPLDLAERNVIVHDVGMVGSFVVAGSLFWLQFIPSAPFQRRMPLLSRAAALLATNVIMIGIAMGLSIFASGSVYPVYAHVPGVTLPPYADQQIGAAILWVCGDFWAVPTMVSVIREIVASDGSMSTALDAILNRGSARGTWGRPRVGALDSERSQPPSSPDAGR